MGSYVVHGDAQRKSLLLVEEAKVFANAVKADDAEVPEYLWNDRVRLGGAPKAEWDGALNGFQKVGYHIFRKGLVRDCARYLADTYGEGWSLKPHRSKDGSQGKMSRDQQAITSMLWHSFHTLWFEFNAGS
jgi:hypothetical protein